MNAAEREPSATPPSQPTSPPQTAPAEAAPTAQAPPPLSAAEVETLRAQLAEAEDRALRFQAEIDNYRKRADRCLEEERRYANLGLLRDLLNVLDNVHRAIAAAEYSPDGSGLLEGVKLVADHLEALLKQYHCQPIEALGAPFDPHRHEAVGQQHSAEVPPGTVTAVVRRGFMLHDRVVRPSQVVVSAAPPTSPQPPASQSTDQQNPPPPDPEHHAPQTKEAKGNSKRR